MEILISYLRNIDKKSQVYVLLSLNALFNSFIYKKISISDTLDPFLTVLLFFLTIALSTVISIEMEELEKINKKNN